MYRVDKSACALLKSSCNNLPIIFDVTHSLQCRSEGQESSGGRRSDVLNLAKAGICQSIAGIFLETHPDPDKALCDGPSALPLSMIEDFVKQIHGVDSLIKSQEDINI